MAPSLATAPNTANLGFENRLWKMADQLRGHIDAAEYKHVVLGLLFLRHVCANGRTRPWTGLTAARSQVGETVLATIERLEAEDTSLAALLATDYDWSKLPDTVLLPLITLIDGLPSPSTSEGRDTLGRVYEYFLGEFASSEGRNGGEFYTPSSVVRLLVELIEPFRGRVYDPCCGSSGMFVQSGRFIETHGGRREDVQIFGQELNRTTWRIGRMNCELHGLEANLGTRAADSFHDDLHKDLQADFILANPPFNISEWGGDRLRADQRWQFGVPPNANANFAWLQHIFQHLAEGGTAGVVLANGSLSSTQTQEAQIRRNLIAADAVDCIVALPGQLFYNTAIPCSLWILSKGRSGPRPRKGSILFIDARRLGHLVDRTHRELNEAEISTVSGTYHRWKGSQPSPYADIPGFCREVQVAEIEAHGFVLTPGRYVGTPLRDEQERRAQDRYESTVSDLEALFSRENETAKALLSALRNIK